VLPKCFSKNSPGIRRCCLTNPGLGQKIELKKLIYLKDRADGAGDVKDFVVQVD